MNYFNTAQNQNQLQKVDSTSYIYYHAGENVPLADYFLDVKYLNSDDLENISRESGKLNTSEIESSNEYKSPVSFQYTDAVLLILISLFSLLSFVRISGKNYLGRIVSSVTNYSYSNSFFKEKNLAYILNNNILMLVFFVSMAMMISVTVDYFKFPVPLPGKWPQLFLYSNVNFF